MDRRPSSQRDATGPQIKVLVVDDDASLRHLLHVLFTLHAGVDEVRVAIHGEDAIEICRAYRPDVVVLDVMMPGMLGDEAAGHIKAMVPHSRIVAYSSTLQRKPDWADDYRDKATIPDADEIVQIVLGD